jgi:hypothetical protein
MTRRFCLCVLSGAVAAAQIGKPRMGYLLDREHNLRAVEGVPGAFTVGPIIERDVLSAAFSGKNLVIKKSDHVRVNENRFDAPEGRITVTFDRNRDVAEIYFHAAQVLWTWHLNKFMSAPAHGIVAEFLIRYGELVVDGVPVRLHKEPREVSQLGEGWLVVYADDRNYAVRGEQVFELPEASEE